MREKIYNIIILLIVIALYIFAGLYLHDNFKERKRKEITKNIIEKVDNIIENNDSEEETKISSSKNGVKYKFTVLGKIRIKKIGINEPILKENTKKAYDVSVVKMAGPSLNSVGNVSIGGHNYMRGNFFIKINKLVKNDVVEITDLSGTTLKYYVYEYKKVSNDDASYLSQPNKDEKIITLVTCTKGGKERYYVKARAK